MDNNEFLLKEAGIKYDIKGDIVVFDYVLDDKAVTFHLQEPETGYLMINAGAGITVNQSNVQEVTKYINTVNCNIPFGTFILMDCCRVVGFKDTIRVFDELPSTEEFNYWLQDCHSTFLAYGLITLSINAYYSAKQAIADLLQCACMCVE